MSAILKINDSRFKLSELNNLKCSCIYKITEIDTGRIYIGKAKNLLKRYNDHKSSLYKGNHPNDFIQKCFNKGRLFTMDIIEVLEDYSLSVDKENFYLKKFNCFDRKFGFNMARNSTGGHSPKRIDVYDKKYNFIETLESVDSGVGKYATNRVSISNILIKKKHYHFTKQGFTFTYHNEKVERFSYKNNWKHNE